MHLQKGLLTLAALALAATSVHAAPQSCQGQTISAPNGQLLCSRTFFASGPCGDGDRLAMLKFNNTNDQQHETQLVDPWEPFPILIVGYRITILDGTMQYALAGNSYTPDIMGSLAAPETSHGDFYPAGTGFAFPAAADVSPHIHLDLHYRCFAPLYRRAWHWLRGLLGEARGETMSPHAPGPSFQGYYTVFYTRSIELPAVAEAH